MACGMNRPISDQTLMARWAVSDAYGSDDEDYGHRRSDLGRTVVLDFPSCLQPRGTMTAGDPRRFHDRVRLENTYEGTVAWLVMERGGGPANAFDETMVDAMTTAVAEIPNRAGCLVLRGEREFSVGADLRTVYETPVEQRSTVIDRLAGASNQFIRGLRGLDVPTVAAVNGTAAGGGLGFALACDILVMHVDAVLDPAYARIGLTPDNATPFFLARALGPYRARELLFHPRAVDADEAVSLGLSSRTVSGDPETCDEKVGEFAAALARVPSSVHGATKRLVDTAITETLEDHLEHERETIAQAASSPVFEEGLEAFFEDRSPDWPPTTTPGESTE